MKKRILSLALVLILAVGLLVACDSRTPLQKANDALNQFTLPAENEGTLTLPKQIEGFDVWWTSSNESIVKVTENGNAFIATVVNSYADETVTLFATISLEEGDVRHGYSFKPASQVATNDEYFDEITTSFKLTKDYKGKSFWTDGIGEAVVDGDSGYVDGDTTRFRLLVGNAQLTIRYHSINTPESTGNVEKWGVQASNFNKQQLKQATEIVLEATTNPPSHDTYGVRYLGYVWYRTAEDEDFKCLNLELVENGYSRNTGTNTADYPYYNIFNQAEKFASAIQLRVHSKLDDPLFSKDPVPMTIKEFEENTDRFYNSDTKAGSKVVFHAYITDLKIASSGTHTFTATQLDEDGIPHSINVYCAYSSTQAARDLRVGHYYRIVGNVQDYYGTFQISSINYSALFDDPDLTIVEQSNYYLIFNSNFATANWTNHWSENLYEDLTVTKAEVANGVLTFEGEARRITGTTTDAETGSKIFRYAASATKFTFTVNVGSNYNNNITVGSVLSLTGLQMVANSGNITILKYADITVRS